MTAQEITAEIERLRLAPYHEIVARYVDLWGHPPPMKSRSFLFRRTAWKLQEQAFGGLGEEARARLEERIAALELPLHKDRRTETSPLPRRGGPKVGAVLKRHYRGEEIHVHVRLEGYEWNGAIYRSLSAVARAITGSRWNGRHFFGLESRRDAK